MRAYELLRSKAFSKLQRHQRRRPPRVRRGFVTGPPDFVGVGAPKSGTTWWYMLIEAHPGVTTRRGKAKELHFFTHGVPGRYEEWFPRRPGTLCGEWDPGYMGINGVLPRLRAAAPDAKILVLLRDPVERYLAGLTMLVAQQGRRSHKVEPHVRRRGEYRGHLEAVLAEYPREHVLVLQYEVCAADPAAQLARTYEFLDLDPDVIPHRLLGRRRNAARVQKVALSSSERAALVEHYLPHVETLTEIAPDIRLALWPNFAHLAVLPLRRREAGIPLSREAGQDVDPARPGVPGPGPA